jgi:hypothetical protein
VCVKRRTGNCPEMAKNLHGSRREQGAFHLMTPYFRAYASNLNRIGLAELIDHHAGLLRYSRARPSLVVNPLSGEPYAAVADETQKLPEPNSPAR